MKRLEHAGLVVMAALVLMACAGVTAASATTISPVGATVLKSTNSSLTIHGASSFSCNVNTISGTVPATSATTVTFPVTLAYSGCTMFGVVGYSITVPPNCQAGGASAVKLNVMYNQATAPQATGSLTFPAGCTITIHAPAITCTMTISGPQTTGLFTITNGAATLPTVANFGSVLLSSLTVQSGGGFGCPTPGEHSGTINGSYEVTTPALAPGVIVTP
jgi:hypothetical protein